MGTPLRELSSMTARQIINEMLEGMGWLRLHPGTPVDFPHDSERWDRWFKWHKTVRDTRIELAIGYRSDDTVAAWSVWHNKRVQEPDQEKGNRDRLHDFIRSIHEGT